MITSTLASGKGASGARLSTRSILLTKTYTTTPAIRSNNNANGNGNGKKPHPSPEDARQQRELFLNVLNANATKRDAKQYLARFNAPRPSNPVQPEPRRDLDRVGVNLGGLYEPARAIAQSPKFTRSVGQEKAEVAEAGGLTHVAVVSLREPDRVDDATLEGLALTLCQLVKLDMKIVLVAPVGRDGGQGERLEAAVTRHNPAGACVVAGALEIGAERAGLSRVGVVLPDLILRPLKRGVVPIIPDRAYTPSGQQKRVSNGDVMVALTEQFSGLRDEAFGGESSERPRLSLDRIIILDPEGGLPSSYRGGGRHVFVNLEQEYDDIEHELRTEPDRKGASSAFATGNHLDNLKVTQRCLAMLPSASSALIIAPEEAASSSRAKKGDSLGTGTRPQKNTLIHNLLTNKPTISSSLPVARMPSPTTTTTTTSPPSPSTATLLKRGMPLTIIPHTTRGTGWTPPPSGSTPLNLATDPSVDFPRLLHLIENSFRRKLNAPHYLSRIANRTAGLIVAGNYEGCALLTYEQPPNTTSPSRLVPYLDKFAVLQSSQGSSGVADVVFQAMVRTCFPRGVVWRSRRGNPVNKWYFERAAGSWQLPGGEWTMFWTGEGVVGDRQRWEDFVGVCGSVRPSWVDGKMD
ncbi:hypothetical protein MBLNU230_g4276t1 [Neophaeotheca triangularis]